MNSTYVYKNGHLTGRRSLLYKVYIILKYKMFLTSTNRPRSQEPISMEHFEAFYVFVSMDNSKDDH
jgi:hypothetical protein